MQFLAAFIGVLLAGAALAAKTYVYQSQFGTFGSGPGQFEFPGDVAIDPTSGKLAVTWAQNFDQGWLQFFTSAGAFASEVGLPLSLDYIAIDPTSANVVATDFFSNEVWIFTSTTSFHFGSAGSGNGQFDNPEGVAIDPKSHNIVVADGHNQRIQIFDSAGNYLSQFSTNGPFADPVAVAIDPATGNIFVTVEESLEVQVFNPAGKFLTAFGAGLFAGIPEGIAVDPVTHNVFVSDTFGDRVLVFAQGGKKKKKKNKPYALITQFGSSGSGNGQFGQPLGIAVDPATGNVIVVDEDNDRVQIFAPQ